MNTPTIPKPKQSPSKTAAYLMRSAFRTLHKGHKKNGLEVIRKLKNELQKIELEIYEERAIEEFMGRVKIKLLEDHPCWIKNGDKKNV